MSKKLFLGTIESFSCCLITYLIFFSFSNLKINFLEMNMQPLIIIIGIMSLRYGTYISFQTVIFASLFYILAYYQVGNDPVLFFFDFHYYKFILIFFFINLCLGRFSDIKNEKINDLKLKNQDLEDKLQDERKQNLSLININEILKERIITNKESILVINQIMSEFLNKNMDEIYTALLKLLILYIKADTFSIYTYNKEKNFLRAQIKVGNSINSNNIEIQQNSIYQKTILEKKSLEGRQNINEPIYIGPILDRNEVIGLVIIEKLKYSDREKYSFQIFKIIIQWMNYYLQDALKKYKIEIAKNYFKKTKICNLEYFDRKLEEEKKRKDLFHVQYVALEGKIKGFKINDLQNIINEKFRDIDIIGMDKTNIKFLFLNTSKENKLFLLEKVSKLILGVKFYEI